VKLATLKPAVPIMRTKAAAAPVTDRLRGNQWDAIRKRVMERDGWLCQPCKRAGRPRTGSEVDHVVPLSEGGSNDPANLQTICTPCHESKTQTERSGKAGGWLPTGIENCMGTARALTQTKCSAE
jgi:5-methylcytosine-specific restriction enzyme A